MSELRCHYSGVPIEVKNPVPGRPYFSCSGCLVAGRLKVDAQGDFPVTPTLLALLAGGLVFFNQGLFWLLSALVRGRGRDATAGYFLTGSLALGVALWVVLVLIQWHATGGGRLADRAVAAFTGLLCLAGAIAGSGACAFAAVMLLAAWGLRGLRHRIIVDGG